MLKANVIERSQSPWASITTFSCKNTIWLRYGVRRLSIPYHDCITQSIPLPVMDDLLVNLASSNFSTLGLK